MHWSDILGWIGFAVVLTSYAMVALQYWHVRSWPSQLGNAIGPGLLGINSVVYHAWVPVALNFLWTGIACYTLLQLFRHDHAAH